MFAGKDYIGVGCGAIIINDKNEVLLLKRTKDARVEAGLWTRPGGEVEFNETAEEATIREVMEETGIEIEIVKFLEFTEKLIKEEQKHWVSIGFVGKYIKGIPENLEPHKHEEMKWFPLGSLPQDLSADTKHSLEVYLENK